jgi:sodium/bile acid cotransporter 7
VFKQIFDPMVRMLIIALGLAVFLPMREDYIGLGQWIANAGIFVLFFLNGLKLSRHQVAEGILDWRFHAVLICWIFGGMLIGGWLFWKITMAYVLPALALGFLYLGALPSTVQSATAYTSIAGGNVAYAVVAAALVNVLGVFLSAPLFALFAGEEGVVFNSEILIKIFFILLVPFTLGQLFHSKMAKDLEHYSSVVWWAERLPIAIAVYVAMSASANDDVWNNIEITYWLLTVATVFLFLIFALLGSWFLAAFVSKNRSDRIAFFFAGNQKSLAVGAPLAALIFEPKIVGIILIPLIIYHFVQLVVAAPIATWLKSQS